MIQRVQSLYLLILVVALIAMNFLPLAVFNTALEPVTWKFCGYYPAEVLEGQPLPPANITSILALVLGLSGIVGIAFYKHRKFQIRLIRNMLIVSILFIASIFYIVDKTSKLGLVEGYAYMAGTYVALIVPVMCYLAIGAIRRDEQKVRAADRLR